MAAILIIGLILYIISIILNPTEHKGELIIFAILGALLGSFYDSTGAKSDWDKKKRG